MAARKLLRTTIIALAICLLNFNSANSQSDEAALRELIDKYFAAYAAEDLGALVRLWSDKSPDLFARFQELEQLFAAEDRTRADLSISPISIRENRAVLTVTAEITIIDAKTKQSRRDRLARSFALIKESGQWKVWRDAPGPEGLEAFLARGGEWKVSRDPVVFDRFAAALISAKNEEERDGLLADNRQLLSIELRQALLRHAAQHQAASNYSAMLNVYAVIEKVAQKTGDKEGAAIAEAGLGDALRNLGRSAQAREHYQEAEALYEALGNKLQRAAMLENTGLTYLAENNYAKALESYQKLLAIALSFKDRGAIANAFEAIASVHYEQGSYDQSLEFFDRALKLREALGRKAEIAATLNNLGNAHYQQENYARAIEHYEKAIKGFEVTGDKLAIAGAMNNTASAHYLQGNYDTALVFYEKSLKIEGQLSDKQGQATSLLGIGVVYYAQGNYRKALEYFEANLALVESMRNKRGAARTLHNIGLVYYNEQNYDAALEYYRKSLMLYEELGDRGEAAIMLSLVGGVYFVQSAYDAALESYGGALVRFEEAKDDEGIANMTASIASVHYAQSDYRLAVENYQKSLARYEEAGNKERVAGTLERIGSVYYWQGDYNQSLSFAERASALAKQDENLETLWRARLTAGAAYRATNQIQKAQQSYEESIAVIETMRDNLISGEQALDRFYKDKRIPYLALMELLLSQNKTSEAFTYAEQVKINTLSDIIQSGGVRITKAMTAAEREQERKLENSIISLKAQVAREKRRKQADQKRLTSLGELLKRARMDHRAFEGGLYRAHPQLKALRGRSRPLKLEEAAGLLSTPDVALLEYVITESRVYLFALAQEQRSGGGAGNTLAGSASPTLQAYALDLNVKDLAERATQFREMIARRDENFYERGRELFDLLLKPASKLLDDKRSLTIVPDSSLWQVPFQALQGDDSRYLLESHAINYASSLTALHELRRSTRGLKASRAESSELIAFANPLISNKRGNLVRLRDAEEKLEGSAELDREVKALGQVYAAGASKFYFGAQASEETAKQQAGNFKVLHFAAPVTLNDVSPIYSHIVFSDPDEYQKDDGLLEAWEVMRLSLRAELAVLSASDTLEGRRESGYGLMGLAWAFFVAGCPATIVSEWRVDSPATTELMLEFHRHLQSARLLKSARLARGAPFSRRPAMSKEQCLQQATLKLIENSRYRHPFYWSGFAVVGDGR